MEPASFAFRIIGSGSDNRGRRWTLDVMLDEMKKRSSESQVVVEYVKPKNH